MRQAGMLPAAPPLATVTPTALDLHARLRQALDLRASALAVAPAGAGLAAVRRRIARLRRRRVRHALGSGTLAAGMVAGGIQLRHEPPPPAAGRPAASAPDTAGSASTAPSPPSAPAPGAGDTAGDATGHAARTGEVAGGSPTAAPRSWTWDPDDRVERAAADPGALYAGGRFHVYATSAEHCVRGTCRHHRVPRFAGPDLAGHGRLEGDAMPERPPWVAGDDSAIWAPAAAPIADGYVLYFAATSGRSGDGRVKCLGAAVAPRPEGPFAPLGEPLLCTPGYWNIDPYPVRANDRGYLLWRQDDAGHATGRIVAAPLAPDGRGLAAPGAPATVLLDGEYPWEEGHPRATPGVGPIENPAMARHPATGEWLLTWSANRWETPDYATGLAVCSGPLGPCRRISGEAPWLRASTDPGIATSAEFAGAGGLSLATGPGGRLDAVFHAYAGTGRAPSPRLGWAYRVDPAGADGYRLVEIAGNQPARSAVSET